MAADRSGRVFEAVLFGATGVTGRQVALQLQRLGVCQAWAIAGRSQEKLEALKAELNISASTIVADVDSPETLKHMAASARLLLNATGPYRFYGEAVVTACIEAGTDYIDLCGEPEFMERMLLQHHEAARVASVLVCHACAFDSVPADLGILRCAQLFREAGGECAHVELFHYIDMPNGYTGHDTTFKAAVHGVGAANELRQLRLEIDEKFGKIPQGSQALGKLPMRGQASVDKRSNKYVMPFIGADASVVRSTRRMQANILKQPDAERLMPQFGIYFSVACNSSILKLLMGGAMFQFLAGKPWGRRLLLNHPGFFTFGYFSAEGPTPEEMQNNCWIGDFYASGLVNGERKSLLLRGRLEDPSYIGTALLFAVVAETLLRDRGSLAAAGGVFTPGALLGGSSLLERLGQRGFRFEVAESELPVPSGAAPREDV
mmetsp:Transcript_93008/g.259119  ORF Transcript_93008/g.259119 Transcript_93008/m.259119 type:complete len:433 (-) Transcript_93008:79-1377(-)